MTKPTPINIGKCDDASQGIKGRDISINLETLLKTRLLIQANSGGGKSWLLRRLAEQLFGKVPVIIIDPEGEFATLREKFGFVLVGKGGETPADSRSAALVAHKLLELRASAVCDLYELKPQERHHWVRLFLDGLMNAPKHLWRPTVVVVDEAHIYCPEGKAGESEASGSVVDLATRGRKRRFGCVLATQRLGKLRKDASAELLNRMVGPTFEDIDLERAADLLSIPPADKREFFAQMRVLEPGNFFALGRAICKERTLVTVGPVQTSHEVEDVKYGDGPPPLPEAVKGLLPKLADLPRQAEEKARTEADLRAEIANLKRSVKTAEGKVVELNQQLAARPPETVIKEIPLLKEVDLKRLEKVAAQANTFSELLATILLAVSARPRPLANGIVKRIQRPSDLPGLSREQARGTPAPARTAQRAVPSMSENFELGKCERALLSVLAQQPANRRKLILLAGYRWSGSTQNAVGRLRSLGLIMGDNSDTMQITEAGLSMGPFEPLPEGEALRDYWLRHPSFGLCERTLLGCFFDHPEGLTRDQLLELSNYTWSGSTQNAVGALRTAEVITGKNNEVMRLTEELLV